MTNPWSASIYPEGMPDELRRLLYGYDDAIGKGGPGQAGAENSGPYGSAPDSGQPGEIDPLSRFDPNANMMQPLVKMSLDESAKAAADEYRQKRFARDGVDPFPRMFGQAANEHISAVPTDQAVAVGTPGSDAAGDGWDPTAVYRRYKGFGKAPKRWTGWDEVDFVKHYYFGGGKPVNLGDIGLAERFEQDPSVRSVTEKFMSNVLQNARPGYTEQRRSNQGEGTNVTWSGPGLFSIGKSDPLMSAVCDDEKCVFSFSLGDKFQDPVHFRREVGGTPYTIDHKWSVVRRYR